VTAWRTSTSLVPDGGLGFRQALFFVTAFLFVTARFLEAVCVTFFVTTA